MTPSVPQQLRRGLWLSAKWVLLPLLLLNVGIGIVDWREQRRNEEAERELLKELEADARATTCAPTPIDCDAFAARILGMPPGRLPAPAAFGPYRFVGGKEGRTALTLWYGRSGPYDQLGLMIGRLGGGEFGRPVADPARYSTSPMGRRYVETVREGRVGRLDWWDAEYHFLVMVLPEAEPGSEKHAAAVALLDAVPA